MHINQARKLANYHKFTKRELYKMLAEALDTYHDEYWKRPNKVNAIFDNGYYFNRCREWIQYEEGLNDDKYCSEIVTVRVLQGFGKFSKVQIPKKKKIFTPIQVSEKPILN